MYRYKLAYYTKEREISPVSIGTIKVALEDGEMFFREKMTGSLVVSGEDYLFLMEAEAYAMNCCQEIVLTIEYVCGGVSQLYWEGYFTLQEIEWDIDNETCTISKVNTKDAYDVIFRNWKKEINWLGDLDSNNRRIFDEDLPAKQLIVFPTPESDEFNPLDSDQYGNGFFLTPGIRYVLLKTLLGTGYEDMADNGHLNMSEFLNASVNPVTERANPFPNVVVMHLADAKRPGAQTATWIGPVTLSSLLEELKKLLNLYWYIDEHDRFKMEHLSFFPHRSYQPMEQTMDLSTQERRNLMAGRRRYSYVKDVLAGREGIEIGLNISAKDGKSELGDINTYPPFEFSSAYMTYSGVCIPADDKGEKTEQIVSAGMFCTDFYSCAHRPDTLPDDGWVLVEHDGTIPTNTVKAGRLPISGLMYTNGNLSACRLYKDFLRYNASFAYGMFSSVKKPTDPIRIVGKRGQTFLLQTPLRTKTTKLVKRFAEIEMPECCGESDGYDFTGYVKHPLSDDCQVVEVTHDLTTQTLEFSLMAKSECNDIPVPEDYDEEEPPTEGCEPYGVYLRTDDKRITMANGNILHEIADIYADGKCGEFKDVTYARTYGPRPGRGNGPR